MKKLLIISLLASACLFTKEDHSEATLASYVKESVNQATSKLENQVEFLKSKVELLEARQALSDSKIEQALPKPTSWWHVPFMVVASVWLFVQCCVK